jgi:glucose-6-phosphate 1-dehydrogenase
MAQDAETKKYMDLFCIEEKPGPCALIIFGASGDLAHRKLIPSLFNLFQKKLLPKDFYIFGYARTSMDTETFRQTVRKSVKNGLDEIDKTALKEFIQICYYQPGGYTDEQVFAQLGSNVAELDDKHSTGRNHIFYIATPPTLYGSVVKSLSEAGLVTKQEEGGPWNRVVIEKPFGRDLASAGKLNDQICSVLSEDQIYRIDHYLGKETVQNILMFRFANTVFEPVWNAKYIDHVQITVAESIGVGHRAGYYEEAGLLRDMFQNHMLQMLALVTMEEPASFEADSIRDRKVELLKSIRPVPIDDLNKWIIRGQYVRGIVNDKKVQSYREVSGVAEDSTVETFVAGKLMVDSPRWEGVPFYLRSGKRMPKKVSEISIFFKPAECSLFSNIPGINLAPNILSLVVQPDEGVSMVIQAKHPGPKLCMSSLTMDFCYKDVFGTEPPDAYQRLLLDCMLGDQALFIRRDGMEAGWSLVTPILDAWEEAKDTIPLYEYMAGTSGPEEADRLLTEDGRAWYLSQKACQ